MAFYSDIPDKPNKPFIVGENGGAIFSITQQTKPNMIELRKWAVEQAVAVGATTGWIEVEADVILAYVTKQD